MENVNQNKQIGEEDLKSLMLRLKNTVPHFKLPCSFERVIVLLRTAVEVETIQRQRKEKYRMRNLTVSQIHASCRAYLNYQNYSPEWALIQNCDILGIDDLGMEPSEIQVYGNPVRPIEELLCYRYEKQLMTLMSSNLPAKDISERYGRRLADRLREVAIVFPFLDDSFRNPARFK